MYFLAGLLTENREGGRAGRRPCLEQASPPLPPAAPPQEETSCRLCCKPRELPRHLAGSPGPGAGKRRRARRLPTFPKHNPREISTPGGGGGCGTGRGREPGAQISTRILFAHPAPASDRPGRGIERGMCSLSGGMHLPEEMVLFGAKFLKIHKPHSQARPPPPGRSSAAP